MRDLAQKRERTCTPPASTPRDTRRTGGRIRTLLARIAFGMLLFAATAFVVGELVVRLGRVEPRVVVLREADLSPSLRIHTLHDRVVWEQVERTREGLVGRDNLDCEGPTVQLYGDSIAFGAGLDAADAPGAQLQRALRARTGVDWCVQVLAQPASTLWSQLGFAREHLVAAAPEVVLVQLWVGSPRVSQRLGGAVYQVTGLRVDEDGWPTFALGLTGGWHHALFDRSRFWAWLTFAVNPGDPDNRRSWQEMVDTDLAEVLRLSQQAGSRLVLLEAPKLDRPFATSADEPLPDYAPARAWAAAHDVPVWSIAELLRGEDVSVLRKNTCCHYAAPGAAALGEALADQLVDEGLVGP